MTLSTAIQSFTIELGRTRSRATVERYAQVLSAWGYHVSSSLSTAPIRDTPPEWVRLFITAAAAPATQRIRHAALRRFFGYCKRQGWVESNPCDGIEIPRAEAKDVRPYTSVEVRSLAFWSDHISERLGVINALLRYTGLRISDVVALRRDALDASGSRPVLTLRARKTRRALRLPLPPAVAGRLAALPDIGAYFFWSGEGALATLKRNIQRQLKDAWDRSTVKGAHPHRYRHTLATRILERPGSTMQDVADALGITVAVAEKHYAKWSPGRLERMARVQEEL